MPNISRYSPLSSLSTFSPLDDVFDNFFQGYLRPVRTEGQPQQMQIRMDVTENDNAYIVHAEIPGVNKDDINVTIDGSQVTISAELTKNTESKAGNGQDAQSQNNQDKGKTLHTERYYGKVFRSFSLGQDVDEEGAEAKYNAGVLELTLPKKAVSTARKLAIQ